MAGQLAVFDVEHERRSDRKVAAEYLLRDKSLRRSLQISLERSCAVDRVVAAVDDELLCRVGDSESESAVG